METAESIDSSANGQGSNSTGPSGALAGGREWVSPGVSLGKRILTGIGVALASVVFFVIALTQGAPMVVSTIIGVLFIGCFVWYLRIVAPMPFTIRLDEGGITRTEGGGEPASIPWNGVAKVKEELFKNGKSVSLTMYKRVGERGLHRAWVVYRDDIPCFDDLATALQDALPEGTPWIRERVHE